jgi:hypothetical protein
MKMFRSRQMQIVIVGLILLGFLAFALVLI